MRRRRSLLFCEGLGYGMVGYTPLDRSDIGDMHDDYDLMME